MVKMLSSRLLALESQRELTGLTLDALAKHDVERFAGLDEAVVTVVQSV